MVRWFCRKMADYHLEMCAEAEDAREFFRGTPYQWECAKAYEDRQYHAIEFCRWFCRSLKW